MKIGIHQVDGNLPNLALMKIAGFHKQKGDEVGWWLGPLFPYDKIYASQIFKFSESPILPDNSIIGGTGIDWRNRLPEDIDQVNPGEGWGVYPDFKKHIGFTQTGCRFECSFCCVPQKEGNPKSVSGVRGLLTNPNGGNRLVLLDDDFFGQNEWEDKCREIIDLDLKVCFSQGLNIRVITEAQAQYLSRIKFQSLNFTNKLVTFAWDQYKDRKNIKRGIDRCLDAGIKPYQMQFFVLIGYDTTPEQDLERVESLRGWGCLPFVMSYDRTIPYQKSFQRWVNHRAVFKTVSWDEYRYQNKSTA